MVGTQPGQLGHTGKAVDEDPAAHQAGLLDGVARLVQVPGQQPVVQRVLGVDGVEEEVGRVVVLRGVCHPCRRGGERGGHKYLQTLGDLLLLSGFFGICWDLSLEVLGYGMAGKQGVGDWL